jgi:ADP-ribosyl-[dinitrogen reductase] hydrolase
MRLKVFGAIAGDVIGSAYEWNRIKTTDFPLFSESSVFTDDTVLTIAAAFAILNHQPFEKMFREFALKYPDRSYGGRFVAWIQNEKMGPYYSWGNGSAMRVSPVGFSAESEGSVLDKAKTCSEVTHNHPEGIKGAQATALAIYLCRNGKTKDEIRGRIETTFNYNLTRKLDEIRPTYSFDESCQGTVPEAIIAFLESEDFESAIRNAVSLGGDSDTLACITGGIADAFYNAIPEYIISEVKNRLPEEFLKIIDEFESKYLKS